MSPSALVYETVSQLKVELVEYQDNDDTNIHAHMSLTDLFTAALPSSYHSSGHLTEAGAHPHKSALTHFQLAKSDLFKMSKKRRMVPDEPPEITKLRGMLLNKTDPRVNTYQQITNKIRENFEALSEPGQDRTKQPDASLHSLLELVNEKYSDAVLQDSIQPSSDSHQTPNNATKGNPDFVGLLKTIRDEIQETYDRTQSKDASPTKDAPSEQEKSNQSTVSTDRLEKRRMLRGLLRLFGTLAIQLDRLRLQEAALESSEAVKAKEAGVRYRVFGPTDNFRITDDELCIAYSLESTRFNREETEEALLLAAERKLQTGKAGIRSQHRVTPSNTSLPWATIWQQKSLPGDILKAQSKLVGTMLENGWNAIKDTQLHPYCFLRNLIWFTLNTPKFFDRVGREGN